MYSFNNKRYLSPNILDKLLYKNCLKEYTSVLGYSVENRPILLSSFGSGEKKVLIWSQMHGNESTTTRSLIQLFSDLTSKKTNLFSVLTIKVIYQLNPDGSDKYSRFNANGVDLNRDAVKRTQPESKLLYSLSLCLSFLITYCSLFPLSISLSLTYIFEHANASKVSKEDIR